MILTQIFRPFTIGRILNQNPIYIAPSPNHIYTHMRNHLGYVTCHMCKDPVKVSNLTLAVKLKPYVLNTWTTKINSHRSWREEIYCTRTQKKVNLLGYKSYILALLRHQVHHTHHHYHHPLQSLTNNNAALCINYIPSRKISKLTWTSILF